MDCIREGNVEEINERASGLFEKAGILSKKHFNNQRNLAIVTTTMATREAIAGGVAPADAYRLSDYLINQIDQCQTMEEMIELNRRCLYKFTKLVADTKKREIFPATQNSARIISPRIITIKSIWRILQKPLESARASFQDFPSGYRGKDSGLYSEIPRKRAANLLKYSDATLSEISDYVCFNSQSHFGSVFKEFMKMTPRQYREKI